MKTLNSILFLILILSLFQCNTSEQSEQNTEQKIATDTPQEPAISRKDKTATAVATNTAISPKDNTLASPSPSTDDVPSVRIESDEKRANAANVRTAPSKKRANDAPSVIELKTPPPPPAPIREEIEEPEVEFVEEMAVIPPPNHAQFDAILRQSVSVTGKVNYSTIKRNSAELDAYIRELANIIPDGSWSRNSAMAYWINAYNAFTLKLIADNYPLSSIKDLHNGNPWEVKWIDLAGNKYSLDQIENEILRPRYGDARIHFAVNCAAKSCPPLHNRAFTEANLNSTLNRLTRSFINNEKYNTISANRLAVSQIFNWYAQDFGTLTEFIDRYTDTEISADATIEYQEYDWRLNN